MSDGVSLSHPSERVSLGTIVREWTRIGCIAFGGPATQIILLRRLCVEENAWIEPKDFEDGIAATNLLPGPAATQLAIYCAWRLRRAVGAILGGLCLILPGLLLILALSAVFLASHPPVWVLGAAAGAGAAVPAVALNASWALVPASRRRIGTKQAEKLRWLAYALVGGAAAATVGPYLVLVLLSCGVMEIMIRRNRRITRPGGLRAVIPAALLHVGAVGGLGALAWVAFKVGALSYGGGFVIVPLMQHDAVKTYHWMTAAQFLNACGPRTDHAWSGRADSRRRRLRSCRRVGRAIRGIHCLRTLLRLRPCRRSTVRPDSSEHGCPVVSHGSRACCHRGYYRFVDPTWPLVSASVADSGPCRGACLAVPRQAWRRERSPHRWRCWRHLGAVGSFRLTALGPAGHVVGLHIGHTDPDVRQDPVPVGFRGDDHDLAGPLQYPRTIECHRVAGDPSAQDYDSCCSRPPSPLLAPFHHMPLEVLVATRWMPGRCFIRGLAGPNTAHCKAPRGL